MPPTVYLNGEWIEADRAQISVQDRGFLFADGIYEVVRYYDGRGFEMNAHVDRLRDSLAAVRIEIGPLMDQIARLSDELMQRNEVPHGIAYWQITRGVAPRKHTFPPPGTPPTVLLMAYAGKPFNRSGPPATLQALTRPDIRWQQCSIKSIALLPNVLDAQAALEEECQEAILHRDGIITEGTHRSILTVKQGVIYTYPLDGRILDSITRRVVLDLAHRNNMPISETPYPLDQLPDADEVIAVGSTTEVAAVTHVDHQPIANAQPGPITVQLLELYRKHVIETCGL